MASTDGNTTVVSDVVRPLDTFYRPAPGKWRDDSQLPPRLLSNAPNTWAYDTMSRRVRQDILARVFAENAELLASSPAIETAVKAIDDELAHAADRLLGAEPLREDGGGDHALWQALVEPFANDTWLSAPWLITEFYFYRKLMAAFRWFEEKVDPFRIQKELGVTSALVPMEALAARLQNSIEGVQSSQGDAAIVEAHFRLLLLTSLWGNRMDLSLWPVGSHRGRENGDAISSALQAGGSDLLNDMSDQVWETVKELSERPNGGRFDIVVDNAGFEIFTDLCLADFVIESGLAKEVVVHLKGHPTFVSDAMAHDVKWMTDRLQQADVGAHLPAVAKRWQSHVEQGKWKLREDLYWAQPAAYWEMPRAIWDDLSSNAGIVIVKGDANYRRLLGDRDWPFSTPFSQVCGYFPAPLCALRTFKAELACGVPPEQQERAKAEDPKWLVSGRFGVIHYSPGLDAKR